MAGIICLYRLLLFCPPEFSRSDLSWTVRIPWTKTYGSAEEAERLILLHQWGAVFVLPAGWVCFCGGSGD